MPDDVEAAPVDGGDGAAPPKQEPINPEMLAAHLKIAAAFRVFDHENNNTIDESELGTVVRSLGCCPSESDLSDLLLQCADDEASGFIKYERFEPMMTKVLLEKKYLSASEDTILRAFQVLDSENQGFLTEEQLQKFLTEEGEAFSVEDFEEMMSAAKDLEKGVVYYDEHAQIMALEER